MSKRRVVITGLGAITPLGNDVSSVWQGVLAGKSGVRAIESFDTTEFTTKFAGLVNNFDPTQWMDAKEARKCDPFIQYGIAAAEQAIKDAKLKQGGSADLERIGVAIGSGIGGLGMIESSHETLMKSGPRRISPFFIPGTIINMISGHVSIMHGFQGPNFACVTACTTGAHNIGFGAQCVAYGDADVMVVGGAEKASTQLGIGGFAAMRALSKRNDEPQKASRPWDRDRDGFVLGDGAAVLILEEYEHAKRRGAQIYAELLGFGMSGDAFHMTRPSGKGAKYAILQALKNGHTSPDELGYINAHATSTPAGDREEIEAIKGALGEAAKTVSISSTKSMTGHLLGAAGAIEALFSILAIKYQIAPPTINLDNPDEGCTGVDLVPNQAKERVIKKALSNSFGFGGTNGSLLFGQLD